jgi:hypothetical protein
MIFYCSNFIYTIYFKICLENEMQWYLMWLNSKYQINLLKFMSIQEK